MDARELRIGNLVTDEYGTNIQVESINNEGVNLYIEDDGNYPECTTQWVEPEYSFDKLRPILLTEEKFLMFGAMKDKSEWPYVPHNKEKDTRFYLVDGFVQLTKGECSPLMNFKHIKSVHQLQNLYFALTGLELTVK